MIIVGIYLEDYIIFVLCFGTGRTLHINSYDTKNNEVATTVQLNAMLREGEVSIVLQF